MTLIALVLVWLGFALLSIAMPRHRMDILPKRKLTHRQQRLLQGIGAGLLVLSGWAAVVGSGLGAGLATWAGLLTLALTVQAMLLTYKPRWLPGSCVAVLLLVISL